MTTLDPPNLRGDAIRDILKRNADDFLTMQETKSQDTRQKEKLAGLVASWATADAETRTAFLTHIGALMAQKPAADKVIVAENLNASNDE